MRQEVNEKMREDEGRGERGEKKSKRLQIGVGRHGQPYVYIE